MESFQIEIDIKHISGSIKVFGKSIVLICYRRIIMHSRRCILINFDIQTPFQSVYQFILGVI